VTIRQGNNPRLQHSDCSRAIYRAKTDADRKGRQSFSDELFRDVPVHPVALEVAQPAGKLEGELAAHGISEAFEDLLIGSTAPHLGYSVATLNARHSRLIPGLSFVQL